MKLDDVISDVLIPVFAILIPSAIAIWLARRERVGAAQDRDADRARATRERVTIGVEHALDAMTDLLKAAFSIDPLESARLRIDSAKHLSRIRYLLGEENRSVWDWAAEELAIVARGLDDRDGTGLPVLGDQVTWRSAAFSQQLSDWLLGHVELEWFRGRVGPPLGDTEKPLPDPNEG